MFVHLKTAAAVLFVASLPLHLGAEIQGSSTAPLTAKKVGNAEKEARTANDHLRLAAWYRSSVSETQNKLMEQEDLANYGAQQPGMASRTKIPNPYWSAQALARVYREKLQNAAKLAARHQQLAESLDAGVSSGE
jgi:hypothetical protein